MNDASSVKPISGWAPTTRLCRLPQPVPPPTGSSTRTRQSRNWWMRWRGLDVRAVGDVLAVDVQVAPPLAVPVAVEPEVEAGAEVEAGVAHRRDGDRPLRSVGHRAGELGAEQPAVVVAHRERGHERGERLAAAVGVLDAALQLHPAPARRTRGAGSRRGSRSGVPSGRSHSIGDHITTVCTPGGRDSSATSSSGAPDHVAHAPRVVAGGHRVACRRARDARRRSRPSPTRSRCGGSGRCRRRAAARRGCGAARAARARAARRR